MSETKLTADEAIAELRDLMYLENVASNFAAWTNFANDLKAILARAEQPEPVEAIDWPDKEGVWMHADAQVEVVAKMLLGEWCIRKFHGKGWRKKEESAHRGFVPCTITAPPIKEPEPKPEKPVRLLIVDAGKPRWVLRIEGRWVEPLRGYSTWNGRCDHVDRTASDPEALEIYDRERGEG